MRALEYALFVLALAVGGLVTLAIAWSGPGPYEDVARANGVQSIDFIRRDGRERPMDISAVLSVHRSWSAYVTGAAADPPRYAEPDQLRFTDDEYAHMADVRRVFDGAKVLAAASVLVLIIRVQRARARGARPMWQLVRSGSLITAAAVVAVGAIAVVAFEPLFLLFHYVFFPQGNFLFDPAASDLVRLYPDWYWEGITLRVGASFVALAAALAGIATLRLRTAK